MNEENVCNTLFFYLKFRMFTSIFAKTILGPLKALWLKIHSEHFAFFSYLIQVGSYRLKQAPTNQFVK